MRRYVVQTLGGSVKRAMGLQLFIPWKIISGKVSVWKIVLWEIGLQRAFVTIRLTHSCAFDSVVDQL